MIIHKEQLDYQFPDGHIGKELLVSYVDKEGNVKFLQYPIPPEQMFEWVECSKKYADPPFFEINQETGEFVTDENGNRITHQWTTYDNKPVRKRETTKELTDNRINEILCSFGKSIDPLFEMNIPNTWFCDIETEVTDEGFPEPEEASTRINTISMTKFPETIIFARKNLTMDEQKWVQEQLDKYSEENNGSDITKGYKFIFKCYETEKEMLQAFVEFIIPITAITGWNFLGFDWLYIVNRCKINNIDLDVVSPTHQHTVFKLTPRSGGNTINVEVPMHKIIYDYQLVFKTWDQTVEYVENHKLDYIAERVLNMHKVSHEWGFKEFYEEHYKEYVFYNCIDTILVEHIDKTINTAKIWYMLTCILRIEANMAFSTIKPTEVVMCNFEHPQYKVFPKKKKDIPSGEQEKYAGAFVWPTRPGIFRYIGGLDFASLYPSIMRQFQVSPETFLFKDKNYEPKDDEIKMVSGAVYKKDKNAMIPSILTHYYTMRKQAKNDKKQAETEKEYLINILNERFAAS